MKAIAKALEQLTKLADLAKTIVAMKWETQEIALSPAEAAVGSRTHSVCSRKGRSAQHEKENIPINKEEIGKYEQADAEFFNILFLCMIGAASYILRRFTPIDRSSGSGTSVWRSIQDKYQPVG